MIDNYMEHTMPMDKCAECGAEFYRRCRKDEWGYWSRANGTHKLFCSGRCVDAYEQREFMEKVKAVANSKSFAAYKLIKTKKMDAQAAMREVGMNSNNSITHLKVHHWKELEWLEKHGWEVAS